MGTQQSRSLHGLRPHQKEKRSGQSRSGESSEGREEGGYRCGTHQTQKQVETEKVSVVPSEASSSDETWASSSTRPAPAHAAPSPDPSQPKPHGLAGAHRANAGKAEAEGGRKPEVDGAADRRSVSSQIKLLYLTLITTNRTRLCLPSSSSLSSIYRSPPPLLPPCSSSLAKQIEEWPLQPSPARSVSVHCPDQL